MERRTFCRLTVLVWARIVLPKIEAKDIRDEVSAVAIPRHAVESTSIASIGYHRSLRVLEIEFRAGAIYRYLDVPSPVFSALMNADSKGRYFAKQIRNRYPFLRVGARQP